MKANEFLDEKEIEYELVEQDKPTKKCENAADERGIETGQIVKSLIVESGDRLFHVCLPGDRTLSEKKLIGKAGEKEDNIRMVEPGRSLELTGQESGTVHPFASELEHFIDQRVFEHDLVSFTVGSETEAVKIDPEDFREALEAAEFGFQVTDLVVTDERDIQQLESEGLDEEKARFVSENGYRKEFLELNQEYDTEMVLKLLMELGRTDESPADTPSEEILERSENETHLQKLVEKYVETGELPEESGFDLDDVVDEVVASNPEAANDFENGKDSAINYLMGQVMKETNGKADGGEVRQMLMQKL